MGALIGRLWGRYDKVDSARRQSATRRLLDSKPAGYLLPTGHGKGPWDDIGGLLTRSEAFAAFRHMLEAADDGFDA
jgi:hypothetical protein